MFELFTDHARRVVVWAQERTRQWDRPDIGTGEMLAALAGEEGVEAQRALAEAGVTVAAVRAEVVGIRPPARRGGSGHVPFSPRMRDALGRAAALATGQQWGTGEADGPPPDNPPFAGGQAERRPDAQEILRPGHLLLALLDDPDCTAVTVLRRLGVDRDDLRESTRRMMDDEPNQRRRGPGPDPARGRPAGRHRPAGTSRFPPADPRAHASDSPFDPLASAPGRHGAGAAGPGHSGGGAAAAAAWAALQRRQAGLPLWALYLWRGDMAIVASEDLAARRLTTRLPLSEGDRRQLRRRHSHAVHEIVYGALSRQSTGPPAGRLSIPMRAVAAVPRSPRTAVTWAMHRRREPLRGWISWLGRRWTRALARCLSWRGRP